MYAGFNYKLNTNGNGYWSAQVKTVQCTKVNVPYINDEKTFGELRIYFDTQSWDVYEDGLIYTDPAFMVGLKGVFSAAGFDVSDLDYSEQGMQGDNFVSCDVGKEFLASWEKIVGCVKILEMV